MIDQLKPLMGMLCSFSQKRMGFQHPPSLFLKKDSKNSKKPLGKTAFYDPGQKSITIYVTNRHPKDILRSFAHELVHHTQNLRGDLTPEKCGNMGNNYAQSNKHMRNMEKEAYLVGNMCFRDWEDGLSEEDMRKYKLAESNFLKENKKVDKQTLKEMIRKVLTEQLLDPEVADIGPAIRKNKEKYRQSGIGKFFADQSALRKKEKEKAEKIKATSAQIKKDRRKAAQLRANAKKAASDILNPRGELSLSKLKDVNPDLAKQREDAAKRAIEDAEFVIADLPSMKRPKKPGSVNVDTAIASNVPSIGGASPKKPVSDEELFQKATQPGKEFGLDLDSDGMRVDMARLSGEPSVSAAKPENKPVAKKRSTSRRRRMSPSRAVRFKAGSQSRLIRKGFMGTTNPKSALREIQQILSELGYPAPVTGKYDQQTYNAIRSFQKSSGIATDGLVGPITYGKMATAMKGQAASAPGLKESLREEIKRQLEIAMGYDMMEFEAEERARDAEKQDSGALEILQSLIDGGKITADELQDAADMLRKQDGEGDEELAEGGCNAGKRGDDPKPAEKPARPDAKKPEAEKPAKPDAKKPEAKKSKEQSQKKFAANQRPFDKATAKDRAGAAPDSPNNKTGKKEKENKEKKAKDDKDLSKVPPQLRSHVAGKANESKIQTPEQENTLYEQRFTSKNNRLFEKLLQEWTK